MIDVETVINWLFAVGAVLLVVLMASGAVLAWIEVFKQLGKLC